MRLFHRIAELVLPAHDGGTVGLKDYRGRYLVLYFYPEANTAGCTHDAQEFGAVQDGKLLRSTFLIDLAGVLRWQWKRVKLEGHVDEVLAVLQDLYDADREINPLIQIRRAWRALSEEPVSQEEITRLIEAAHLAPSCFNNQPWRFVVATGERLEAVKEALAGGNYWAKLAPGSRLHLER